MRVRRRLRTIEAGWISPLCTAGEVFRSHHIRATDIAGIFVLIALSVNMLFAQSAGKISGVVTDHATREPLIDANILILGTSMGAGSGVDGTFFILNVPPGTYDIQASMIGYQRVTMRGVVVDVGRTTTISFQLDQAAIVQAPVVVEAVRPDVEREKTSTSAIVRTDEVQQIAGMRDVGDVLALAADVTDGHFRGGRSGEELYTLQGMGIVNPLNSSRAFLPILSAVEVVEVITSGFGAQYGNAQSGVVNISMREGKSDRWRTRAEVRTRLPGRKHFGPGVFDPEANPYLAFLSSDSAWRQRSGTSGGSDLYYAAMASGLTNLYGLDTTVQIQVARTLWNLQARRDLNRTYGNDIDYSAEVAAGGPVDDNFRVFVAFRSNVEWPVFPTEQPDVERQIMGNIVYDVGRGASVRLSGGYSRDNNHVFPGANTLGYYNWIWDRILDVQYQKITNSQLGIRFTQALGQNAFFEVKLNTLQTHLLMGSSPAPSFVPDSEIVVIGNRIQWSKTLTGSVTAPDKFTVGLGTDDFRDELTRTMSLEASITSQMTKVHELNGGIQYNYYLIDVMNRGNVRTDDGGPNDIYSSKPMELGLYVQDKMEFEGMIANAGLRFDLWSQNTKYFPDVVSPYRQFRNAHPGDTSYVINPDSVDKKQTPILGRLQPRVGFSFPVSTSTVFHLNYGSFMQRPSFQYTVRSRQTLTALGPIPTILGNPRLEPQTTNSYDMGVMQGLGEGFTFDVSGYYKDVKNLIQSVFYTDVQGRTYQTFVNRDYADIRGFRISLNKRRGSLTGSINYQYSVATGKSSTPLLAPVSLREGPIGTVTTTMAPSAKDILLDFDRTHNLIINLAYVTDEQWGPSLSGIYPFGDLYLSSNSFVRSGRPYTWDPLGEGLLNNMRTPVEHNTNVRITKKIRDFFGAGATIYFEVFNLFNNKILNYNYLFAQGTPSATSSNVSNTNIEAYETLGLDNPNGVRYYNDNNRATPFGVDQSFLIYENSPRSFTFGFVIEF